MCYVMRHCVCVMTGMLPMVNLQPFVHQTSPVINRAYLTTNGTGTMDMYQSAGQETYAYMQANTSPQPSGYTYVSSFNVLF